MPPIPLTETQMAELFRLRSENAALKEQVAQLKSSVQHEADCVDSAAAEINRQAAENDKLKETIAQQAEAIRLKDAALDWCIGEFNLRLDDIDLSQETILVLSARHIQPSPEILQARDDRVAEACALMCHHEAHVMSAHGDSGVEGANWCGSQIRNGGWKEYL